MEQLSSPLQAMDQCKKIQTLQRFESAANWPLWAVMCARIVVNRPSHSVHTNEEIHSDCHLNVILNICKALSCLSKNYFEIVRSKAALNQTNIVQSQN